MLQQHAQAVFIDGIKSSSVTVICYSEVIKMGIDDVETKLPKVRNRSSNEIHFSISLLLFYLKRIKTSKSFYYNYYTDTTDDFDEALLLWTYFIGEKAHGLSKITSVD
ncbi:MAG: hypothetical protein ACTS7E_00740 [Arsenophonus sp. NC-CH8-MAG3]